jgi:hypothetical protein
MAFPHVMSGGIPQRQAFPQTRFRAADPSHRVCHAPEKTGVRHGRGAKIHFNRKFILRFPVPGINRLFEKIFSPFFTGIYVLVYRCMAGRLFCQFLSDLLDNRDLSVMLDWNEAKPATRLFLSVCRHIWWRQKRGFDAEGEVPL